MSFHGRVLPWLGVGTLALAAAGCATRSIDVKPRAADPATYAAWSCERLAGELDRVQQRAADVAYAVDARVGNNMIALGLGVTVFWPALLAMRPDGIEAAELAELKGRFEALHGAAARRRCAERAPEGDREAALPVRPGDRLVYEYRSGHRGAPHELGMRVAALQRDQLEFAIDLDGQVIAQGWRQDIAGNAVLPARPRLIGWQGLLQPDLELGQVLAGELTAGEGRARVRGQVVATGPQQIADRVFDVAVIELFGDAPVNGGGLVGASTRLDGVMSVDRRSGVLLRLELRCDNVAYALKRRLVRVEASGS